jgi:hypothetical protein
MRGAVRFRHDNIGVRGQAVPSDLRVDKKPKHGTTEWRGALFRYRPEPNFRGVGSVTFSSPEKTAVDGKVVLTGRRAAVSIKLVVE